jgi:hypothetical protein
MAQGEEAPLRARVPLEAVQLCIDNALRLLEDSDGVSEPTRAALIELSLEEIAKGWVLIVNLSDFGKQVLTPEQMLKASLGESTTAAYRHHLAMVTNYFQTEVIAKAPKLEEVFRTVGSHRKKLEFVGRLLEWTRLIISGPVDQSSAEASTEFYLGPAFRARTSPEARLELQEALDSLNPGALDSLTAIKEGGFYVDRSPGEAYVSPTSLVLPDLDELEAVTGFMLELLKLNFLWVTRVTGHTAGKSNRSSGN